MAETTIVLGDWNSITPAAPAGRENIDFAVDRSGAIPKFSASVKTISRIARFLVGIGGALDPADDIAPVYRVAYAGTVTKCRIRAKSALENPVSFMVKRRRNTSPVVDEDILTDAIEVPAGSIEWIETSSFDNDDLQVDDELILNQTAGSAENITIELIWS
jgi:hypothetical protein